MSARNYVDYIFLERIYPNNFDASWGNKWIEESELRNLFVKALHAAFKTYGVEVDDRWDYIAGEHFEKMVELGIIEVDFDPFAGRFFRINPSGKDGYVVASHEKNDVADRVKRIGDVVLTRAIPIVGTTDHASDDRLDERTAQNDAARTLSDRGISIPASDRIVSIDHNMRAAFDENIETVSELLRGQNDDIDPSFKNRILGQIRAGRELLLAGTFKAFLLYETLLSALGELISRYGKSAVGVAATALLQALIEKGVAG